MALHASSVMVPAGFLTFTTLLAVAEIGGISFLIILLSTIKTSGNRELLVKS